MIKDLSSHENERRESNDFAREPNLKMEMEDVSLESVLDFNPKIKSESMDKFFNQ